VIDRDDTPMFYILDENRQPVPAQSTLQWADWMERHHDLCRVKVDTIGPCQISTIFLGLDATIGLVRSPPRLFETAVFGPGLDDVRLQRCSTYEQALAQHEAVVKEVEGGGS
jgi:hypothetical protein